MDEYTLIELKNWFGTKNYYLPIIGYKFCKEEIWSGYNLLKLGAKWVQL
jgi:hypothetical protein